MECPYYLGIEERGKDKGIRCTKGCLLLMSDEKIKESLEKQCVGESERDHCRPFLFRKLEEIGMNPESGMDTERDLRRLYLEKMSESGTTPQKEANSMSEELKTTEQVEVSSRREYAERLHNEILHNADMVSSYLVELCKDLKRMRDERYYTELGYDTFDDYVEKDVGIKKRQAYTYIGAYEKLGDTFLQSNAHLGITRLALLTEVPAADRPDFAEDNDLANMSTREIKAIVEKTKQQGEQLSLLSGEREEVKAAAENSKKLAEDFADELDRARIKHDADESARQEAEKRASELAAELEKIKNAEPEEAALAKLKKQAEREAKKDLAEKIKAAEEKAAAAARAEEAKKIQAAREEAEKSAAERIKQGLAAVEQEKAAALQRAAELEKQLKVSGNKDTVMFSFLFSEEQELVNKMSGLILKIEPADAEMAGKLRGALKQVLGQQMEEIGDV